MQNSGNINNEKDDSLYNLPPNSYDRAPVGSNPELARQEDKPERVDDNGVKAARDALVNQYDQVLRPNSEESEEAIVDRITNRGEQIKRIRLQYLAKNPYKYPRGQTVTQKFVNAVRNSLYEPNTEEMLIENERQKIGGKIFQIPGFTFFLHDPANWYTHQELLTPGGTEGLTTHYQVYPMAVFKSSSEPLIRSEFVSGEELRNFDEATRLYLEFVIQEYNYHAEESNYDHDNYASKMAA